MNTRGHREPWTLVHDLRMAATLSNAPGGHKTYGSKMRLHWIRFQEIVDIVFRAG